MKSALQSLQEQRLLLQMEYAAEREAYRIQVEEMGLARRVKRGDAWYPVTVGRSFYNSLNQRCLEIFRTQDHDVEHNFEYGKQVTVGGRGDATVSFVDGDRMVLVIPDNFPVADVAAEENLSVQLSFDETSYRAMFDALARAIAAKGNRLAYLRDLFYSNQPAGQYQFEPQRFPWLNATQEQAVNKVLRAKDVAVVHGPPGTGKTTTLVEAINETLRRENQVLVCAQSNMAVDWISEQLVDRGISVLRIGNPTRVNDKMLSFTYERRFESHPDYPQLWAIRKAIRELRSRKRRADERYHQKLESLKGRALSFTCLRRMGFMSIYSGRFSGVTSIFTSGFSTRLTAALLQS